MNPWYPVENVRVVNNPAIGDDFWSRLKWKASHPWLRDDDPDWKTFVTAGAFVESKGHRYLIEAIRILSRHDAKVRVIIFGQGDLENEYRKMIMEYNLEKYVSLGGYSPNIPAELAHAHGYVMTSLVESFGISLVEGLAAGCKIVSFDCPFGPEEILDKGRYGSLVPVGDVHTLAHALANAAAEKRSSPPIDAWNRYTVDAIVKKYIAGLN